VIAAARTCAVNAHFGIPPRYRGNDTLFWALSDRAPECVGGVLHHLDAGIDTGAIVAECYPALTPRDRWLCSEVGPVLRRMGVIFAGLDVIGDYLTEINVTSPTGIRELEAAHELDIAGQLIDAVLVRRLRG